MGLKILLKLLPLVLIGALSAPSAFAVQIGKCKSFVSQNLCHTEDSKGITTPAPNYRYFKQFRGVAVDDGGYCQRVEATQILEEECNLPKYSERLYKVRQLTMTSSVPAGCKCKLRVAAKNLNPAKTNAPGSSPNTAAVVAENKETPGTSSTATPTPAPTTAAVSPDVAAYLQKQEEGKTQTEVTTNSDGTITKKTYVDTDGDHKLDRDEDVSVTKIGKEIDGRFVVTETIKTGDKSVNATRYTYTDANGDEHELTSAAEAKAWAQKNDAKYATVTKNGKTYRIDPKTGELYSDKEKKDKAAADAGKTKKELAQDKKDLADPCSTSLKIAQKKHADGEITKEELAKFRCQGTQDWVKGAEVANQVLTTAGRTVVNTMGVQSVQNARRGTFADAQDGAAKMAKTTQTYETVLGVANLAATAKLATAARKHKKAVGDLATWKEKSTGGSAYDNGGQGFQDEEMSQARYDAAVKEQTGARNIAATAAMKTAIQGMQSLTAAKVAAKIAKDSKANAKLARQNEALLAQQNFNYDPNQLAGPGNTNSFDPNAAAATGGDGTQNNSDASTTELDPNQPAGPLLGGGNDLGGGDDSLNAPVAGKFKGGGAPAGGGGGSPGGGAAGGGGGGANPAAQEEAKAAYASEFGTKERYESGGGAPGGPKGAGKGEKDDPGIDLNGLLAQFLPKGEEDLGPKNGILDSVAFGGNRNVATEEPSSLLDKNADLFQRIHDTMSEKNRRGQLGI